MDDEQDILSFIRGTGIVIIGVAVGNIAIFIERIILGNIYSVNTYGRISVGLSAFAICLMIAQLGVPLGVARYIPRFEDDGRKRSVWFSGISLILSGSLLVAAIGIFATTVFDNIVDQVVGSNIFIYLLCITLIPISTMNTSVQAIRGMENGTYRVVCKDLIYPIGRIIIILLFAWWGLSFTSVGAAYLLSGTISAAAAVILLNRLLKLHGELEFIIPELVKFSIPLMLSSVVMIILTKMDTIMLGALVGPQEAGLYGAAFPIANGLTIVLSAFGYLYLPMVSRFDSNEGKDRINNIYSITSKWIFMVTFPAFVVFSVFPSDILSIFFSTRYSPAAPALIVLAVGFFTNASFGRNQETLSAIGSTKLVFVSNLFALVFNIILNLLLIPSYGIIGAAVASASSFLIMNIFSVMILEIRHNISLLSGPMVRTVLSSFIIIFPLVYYTSSHISIDALSLFPSLMMIGIAVVTFSILTGGIEQEDMLIIEVIEERIGVSIPLIRRYIE
jgi:O-antigen/teichoic acid export membrane protein